jgi:hypothetical protein
LRILTVAFVGESPHACMIESHVGPIPRSSTSFSLMAPSLREVVSAVHSTQSVDENHCWTRAFSFSWGGLVVFWAPALEVGSSASRHCQQEGRRYRKSCDDDCFLGHQRYYSLQVGRFGDYQYREEGAGML